MIGLPSEDVLRKKLHVAAETARRMRGMRRIEGTGKALIKISKKKA